MSAAFEFRKLYLDVIGAAGDITVLYVTAVRLLGVWTVRRSLEHYGPDGSRTTVALPATPTPAWDTPLEEARAVVGPFCPAPAPFADTLDWRVKAVRAEVAIRWPGRSVSGTGYADWVRMTRPGRLLGLRRLVWGRVHLPDRTVVFEDLETVRGEVWSPSVEWRVGEAGPRPIAARVTVGPDGEGRLALADGELLLKPSRVLHDGDAYGPERVPGAATRALCHTLGGPTWQTRWAGTAALNGLEAPALYERVRFGREGSR